jgi:SAM-dependent methyltransferase
MSDKGFDLRWREFPRPQVTTRETWVRKAGMQPEALRGKSVLDAGCGCGRNMVMLQQAGVENVWGCDISPSGVTAARENTGRHDEVWRVDLVGGRPMLEEVPWGAYSGFDFVFSHGVLHHTGDPRLAFHNVADCVKPGGRLSVWLYAQPAPTEIMPHVEFLHAITRNCPPEALLAACRAYALQCRDLNAVAGVWDALRNVLQVSQSEDDDECVSDTFDWHCPRYRSWHTAQEVLEWFNEEGFEADYIGEFPVSVRGMKR